MLGLVLGVYGLNVFKNTMRSKYSHVFSNKTINNLFKDVPGHIGKSKFKNQIKQLQKRETFNVAASFVPYLGLFNLGHQLLRPPTLVKNIYKENKILRMKINNEQNKIRKVFDMEIKKGQRPNRNEFLKRNDIISPIHYDIFANKIDDVLTYKGYISSDEVRDLINHRVIPNDYDRLKYKNIFTKQRDRIDSVSKKLQVLSHNAKKSNAILMKHTDSLIKQGTYGIASTILANKLKNIYCDAVTGDKYEY